MPLSVHAFFVFIASGIVLCIVPGPDMAYMLGRTVTQGRRAGFIAAIGINAGAYVHVIAAVLGLSAILANSAAAFTVVKIIGAAYLVWLGMRTFTSASATANGLGVSTAPASLTRIFWDGFLSDALNPKVAIFFLAFLPQFVDRTDDMVVPLQLLFSQSTCNIVALAVNFVLRNAGRRSDPATSRAKFAEVMVEPCARWLVRRNGPETGHGRSCEKRLAPSRLSQRRMQASYRLPNQHPLAAQRN